MYIEAFTPSYLFRDGNACAHLLRLFCILRFKNAFVRSNKKLKWWFFFTSTFFFQMFFFYWVRCNHTYKTLLYVTMCISSPTSFFMCNRLYSTINSHVFCCYFLFFCCRCAVARFAYNFLCKFLFTRVSFTNFYSFFSCVKYSTI